MRVRISPILMWVYAGVRSNFSKGEFAMGDRANVGVTGKDGTVFFYTHWSGSKLPEIVAAGLERGETRWSDTSYLRRIIFCELIKNSVLDETGYGISLKIDDIAY